MRIVIVGSGLAGVTAGEALAKNPANEVMLVTAETHGYYSRPRLSHGVALADQAASRIVMKGFDALASLQVLAGAHAARIDRERRRLVLRDERAFSYDILILATGSAARIPPPLVACRAHFFTLNSLDDLLALRERRASLKALGKVPHWAVVGGGLIGCELASDLRKAEDRVTLFHREARLMELQLDEAQSLALHEHFADWGIEVRYAQDVHAIRPAHVLTAQGEVGPFDAIVVATGFAPRVELVREAGLAAARGIETDAFLRTSDARIYALGDVAQIDGRLYPFVSPIRAQALWLAEHLEGRTTEPWSPPAFAPVIKVHGFDPRKVAAGT